MSRDVCRQKKDGTIKEKRVIEVSKILCFINVTHNRSAITPFFGKETFA